MLCPCLRCRPMCNLPPNAWIWGIASFHRQKPLQDGISLGKIRLDHCLLCGLLLRYLLSIALPLASIRSNRKMTC